MSATAVMLLSYCLLAVFLVVFSYRTIKMARLPVHLRWELSPVPHEKGRGSYGGSYLEEVDWWTKPREKDVVSEMVYMGKEILFLKALFEHNRKLWWFSFPFHGSLYLLIGSAGLFILGAVAGAFGVAGPGWGLLTTWVPLVAGIAYGLGALGAAGLFLTRLTSDEMRNSTAPATFLNLMVLLAMFVTGLWAVLSVPDFGRETLRFGMGLLYATPLEGMPGIVNAHMLFVLLFLAWLPFTQMMHFVAKYFTYHKVRWDDEPVTPGSKLDRELKKMLGQSPTWAAAHVGADGEKTWVDIATETRKVEEAPK